MTSRVVKFARNLVMVLLAALLVIGALVGAKNLGALSFVGVKSETSDSQIVAAVERTQEVSLVGLSIQGIKDEKKCATIFGKCVPSSGDKVFLVYTFTAKLGLDGADVKVTKTGENNYLISVPTFEFIGYDEPTFKVAVRDGGVLSFLTPNIDELELVNEILSEEAQASYLTSNTRALQEQTEVFYDSLVTSISPDAETTFEFSP